MKKKAIRKKQPENATAGEAATAGEKGGGPLNPDRLQRLYQAMLKCRMVASRAVALFRRDNLAGHYWPPIGHEATAIGAVIDLHPEDMVAPSQRNSVAQLLRGIPLKQIFGTTHGRMAPAPAFTASSVAAQLDIASSVALAYKQQKSSNIVVAISGGASSFGLWAEPVKFAGAEKLPIVYVVENNLWAEPAQAGNTAAEGFWPMAQALGVAGITVDGNDVVAVCRVCHEAREHAREGYGPTLVECKTYGWHSAAQSNDPITHMEQYLRKRDLWSDGWKQEIVSETDAQIEAATQVLASSPQREAEQLLEVAAEGGEWSETPFE